MTWDNKSGAERTRTADPLLAKQVLYQLSYRPREMQRTRSKTPAHVLGSPSPQSKESRGGRGKHSLASGLARGW
jgi:hypothetical protein